ncbi:hypothetical protein F442_12781 [Phytophthora nicotianae P10297]|uniref:BZIP domain-containing protein n=1 Tax=Phytophthora nicotianae P10297 TaxID=1317064 RepID=W2YYB4_PHYNI|nr:hypothetical protein F442_12781 [Phytophthora nicotianae P10297]
MSFLISPSDPETLAEALAFVDGFDFPDNDSNTDASSGSSDSGAGTFVESHKRRRSDVKVADTHEKAKSRRKNAVYSARLRAKKKNEMQTLKDQVEQLQMQLDRLKSAHTLPSSVLSGDGRIVTMTSGSSITDTRFWLKEATAQAYQRQQAEQLNAQLKVLLAKVVKRSRTMQDAFQNLQSLGCEIKLAVGAPSTILAGFSLRSNDATSYLEQLREYADQMYASAPEVFATSGAGAVESASFVSQIKRDLVSGRRFVQLSSVTPLASDLDTTSRMIWKGMQLRDNKCSTYNVHRLHVNTSSIAKSFFLTLGDDDPTSRTLHGAAFVRKFEERDRILYIWTTAMVPPRQEVEDTNSNSKLRLLCVREKGWVMLSRSIKNPEHESLLRTCYEVSSELDTKQQDASCATTETDYSDHIGNRVINLLSSELRGFHERIQNKLLAGTA